MSRDLIYTTAVLFLCFFVLRSWAAEIKGVNPPPATYNAAEPLGHLAAPLVPVILSSSSVIDVKQYGARGDGIADDTVAFKQALKASAAVNKRLYIPNGRYRITETLSCDGLHAIVGEDYMQANLIYEGEGYCLNLQGMMYGVVSNLGINVVPDANGKFKGSGLLVGNANSQEPTNTGIGNDGKSDRDRAAGLTFWRICVTGGNIGVRIDGGCWINYYYSLRVQGCDVGLYLGTAANSNDFFAPIILSNRIGIQLAGPLYGVHFWGGLNEENTEKGVYFSNRNEMVNVSISGMYFENMCTDVYIDGCIRNLNIQDCYFAGYAQEKKPVLVHTNQHPYSDIVFRGNFAYLAHQPVYAELNGATIVVENSWDFADHVRKGTVLRPAYSKIECP